jgi:hypothetical protein
MGETPVLGGLVDNEGRERPRIAATVTADFTMEAIQGQACAFPIAEFDEFWLYRSVKHFNAQHSLLAM